MGRIRRITRPEKFLKILDNNSLTQISKIFSEFNVKNIKTESYKFINNLLKIIKIFLFRSISQRNYKCFLQIYTLSKCYELLINNKKDYDLIFRCRFDSIYLHLIYILKKFTKFKLFI